MKRVEEIFLAEGFSHLTIDELARRLRCSKTTIYTIAQSREQIVQAVTRHFFSRATEAIERAITDEPDPAKRIKRYLHGVGEAMSRNSSGFYLDMVSYPPTAEIYRINSDAAARRVRAFIDEGVGTGRFQEMNAALAGEAIALLIDGVQSGALLRNSEMTAGMAFSELGDLLVDGLRTRSTDTRDRA